jgi:thioredoxin reductase
MGDKYDVAIIGSGVAGLAAAVYCGRLGLNAIVIGKEKGGTILKTDIIENYPGTGTISAQKLIDNFLKHTVEYGVEIKNDFVEKVSWSKRSCFSIKTKKGKVSSKTVLFATGSAWKKLGVVGEEEYRNKGVHYCALCDAPLYKNKVVVVVGGGDAAAKESLLIAKYARKVYVMARHSLKGEGVNMERVKKEKKIEVIENVNVKGIKGDKFVTGVVLDKVVGGSKEFKTDAVFVDIGHVPLSSLAVPLGVKLNRKKEIAINKESKTNIIGVWAAGDVADTKFKQAITGVGEAVKAVYSIYEYLTGGKVLCSCVDENC